MFNLNLFSPLFKKRFYYLVSLVLFIPSIVFSQAIDSLKQELKLAAQDSNRVKILNELASKCKFSDPSISKVYCAESISLAEKISFFSGLRRAYTINATILYYGGKPDSSIHFLLKAAHVDSLRKNYSSLGSTYSNLGTIHFGMSQYTPAKKYLDLSVRIAELYNNEKAIIRTSLLSGVIYIGLGKYYDAIPYYEKALRLAKEYNDQESVMTAYMNLAICHSQLKNEKESLSLNEHARLLAIEQNNIVALTEILHNISIIYAERKDRNKALEYLHESYKYAVESNNQIDAIVILISIADMEIELGKYEVALQRATDALKHAREFGGDARIANALTVQAEAFLFLDKIPQANTSIWESIKLAMSVGSYELIINAYEVMADLYRISSPRDSSFIALENVILYKDSLYRENKEKELANFRVMYELEEQEKKLIESEREIEKLKYEKVSYRFRSYILTSAILFLTVTFALWWRVYSRNKKLGKLEKESLVQQVGYQEKELEQFALSIVERQTLIKRITQLLETPRKENDKESTTKALEKVYRFIRSADNASDKKLIFKEKVASYNQSFFERIEKEYVSLTSREKQLAVLLKLNLKAKEIAHLLDITPQSVEVSKSRLKKKLELSDEISLQDWLNSI